MQASKDAWDQEAESTTSTHERHEMRTGPRRERDSTLRTTKKQVICDASRHPEIRAQARAAEKVRLRPPSEEQHEQLVYCCCCWMSGFAKCDTVVVSDVAFGRQGSPHAKPSSLLVCLDDIRSWLESRLQVSYAEDVRSSGGSKVDFRRTSGA